MPYEGNGVFKTVDDFIAAVGQGARFATLESWEILTNYSKKSSAEIAKLAQFLATDNTLLSLNVSGHFMSNDGVTMLLKALSSNTTLQKLNLSRNRISDEGLIDVIAILKNNTLQELLLDQIDITDSGFESLSVAVQDNRSLRELSVSSHKFTDTSLTHCSNILNSKLFLNSFEFRFLSRSNETRRPYIPPNDKLNEEFNSLLRQNANLLGEVDDAVEDFAKSILATKFIKGAKRGIHEDSAADLKAIFMGSRVRPPQKNYTALFIDITRKCLLENLSYDEIKAFSAHWHSPFHQAMSLKLRDYDGASWSSLFGKDAEGNEKKEINIPKEVAKNEGWKLVARLNPDELKKEGVDLNHCVGGYSDACFNGNSHIISIVNEKGESLSTIQFYVIYDEQKIDVLQHHGRGNAEVSADQKEISKWFLRYIEKEKIINCAQLKQDRKERMLLYNDLSKKATRYLGFNPFDDDKCREVLRVFRKMIPNGTHDIPNLTDNFQRLVDMEVGYDEHLSYAFDSLVPYIAAEVPVVSQEQSEQNIRKKLEEQQQLLEKIQENIDKIFGAGLVVVNFVGVDSKSFGNVQLLSSQYDSKALRDVMCHISPKFAANIIEDSDKIVINNLKPRSFNDMLKGAIAKEPDISRFAAEKKKVEAIFKPEEVVSLPVPVATKIKPQIKELASQAAVSKRMPPKKSTLSPYNAPAWATNLKGASSFQNRDPWRS